VAGGRSAVGSDKATLDWEWAGDEGYIAQVAAQPEGAVKVGAGAWLGLPGCVHTHPPSPRKNKAEDAFFWGKRRDGQADSVGGGDRNLPSLTLASIWK